MFLSSKARSTPQEADPTAAQSSLEKLYRVSKTLVGPVVTGFADHLLKVARGDQLAFAARDGLGAYEAARILTERFGAEYDRTPEDVHYAYLTRKVVFGDGYDTVGKHLEQLGIKRDRRLVLGDIGMYGSFISSLEHVVPDLDVRYLISATPNVEGFAHDPRQGKYMESMRSVIGNPAVHFMEDTFSGPIESPTGLVDRGDGLLVPNTIDSIYDGDIAARRNVALRGITDYARSILAPPDHAANMEGIANLDAFLSDPANFKDIMVPHER